MLHIESFTFNPFAENTYLVYDDTKETIIIDPGCCSREEENYLADYISGNRLVVKQLINTHCHIDHVLGNYFVKSKYRVPLFIHPLEEPLLRAVKTYAPNYGFPSYHDVQHDGFLSENDVVVAGDYQFNVLFVPGHSPGHIALYNQQNKILISGDVLFENSIGRTDLPGGDYDILIESIQTKLFSLPDEVTVYCGHGPTTTIGNEKRTNPFCALAR
ncbi:MAG: MBL fold metallo-hydrolase [Flammeovirgaceae bacterium]|nr:MAG: MBL fold metallo-hydrolase [Flammeovirgaceae bacterium]